MFVLQIFYQQDHLPSPFILSDFGVYDVESKEHHDLPEAIVKVEGD